MRRDLKIGLKKVRERQGRESHYLSSTRIFFEIVRTEMKIKVQKFEKKPHKEHTENRVK